MMVNASVSSMNSIADAAVKIEKEQRLQNILGWITAVMFVVPFVGDELSEAASGVIEKIGEALSTLSDLYNIGTGIYDSTQEIKDGWISAIAGVFLGRALGQARKVEAAAKAFQDVADNSLRNVGVEFSIVRSLLDRILPIQ